MDRAVKARERYPHAPSPIDRSVAASIKALAKGEASPEQQMMALRWVVLECAGKDKDTFFPENARLSDFASGKRFVGSQIDSIIAMPMSVFDK
jgi:hypothetical protein